MDRSEYFPPKLHNADLVLKSSIMLQISDYGLLYEAGKELDVEELKDW